MGNADINVCFYSHQLLWVDILGQVVLAIRGENHNPW